MLTGLIAVWALAPASASASSNNAPSNAPTVKTGIPFAGNWPGTVYVHGYNPSHWWRMPSVLRPGDQVQIAADNRLGTYTVYFCLVPAVDDFGADSAFEACGNNSNNYLYFEAGQQSRGTLTYDGPSGQGFLVAWIRYCCPDRGEALGGGLGQYTGTIERIISLVNIGIAVPPALPPQFTLSASVVYGDNAPAADGTPAVLQWRPVAVRGTDPVPFATVASAASLGGLVTFTGAMPAAAQGERVQIRACVAQPGGDGVRCAPSSRTQVGESACSRALDNQLVWGRVVHRLAKKLKNIGSGPAKIRLKRKLKAKRKKLAKASKSVKAHCV